jgi:hypothetical protein
LKPTLVVLALLLFAGISQADTTYDYIGNQFTSCISATGPCNVTGEVTLSSPLVANSLQQPIPVGFSFTSIGLTITQGNSLSSFFQFQTDGSDNIVGWRAVVGSSIGNIAAFNVSNIVGGGGDNAGMPGGSDGIAAFGSTPTPGVWTMVNSNPTATPEPSSILLLASGLALVALLSKKTLRA